MAKLLQLLCFLVFYCVAQSIQQDFEDISPLPTVFESTTLPVDENGNFIPRQMASVGNGHVATTVYTDTVHMNGLYNGERGESHRARIPSGNNIRINTPSNNDPIQRQTFALDVGKGVFSERIVLTGGTRIEQRTFAHRFYTRVIVTQIEIENNSSDSVSLSISNNPGASSDDLNTPETGDYGTLLGARYMCAETLEKEDSRYQETMQKACSISTAVPNSISIAANSSLTQTYITAYGFDLEEVQSDFNAVANMIVTGQHNEILQTHVQAWEDVWTNGAIQVEGNTALAKVVYGSLYYILSSLPVSPSKTHTPNGQFYGLSPGGLAYGTRLADYQGHSFWDTETWMYPPILYLYPDLAKEILNYRLHTTGVSRDHANATGYKGARFVWESARTGREVTPDCCPNTSNLQVHISSDISYAIRQYIAVTRDLKWLTERQSDYVTNGCGLLRDIAEFWTSRSTYNAATGLHEIKNVMPPDEDNYGVDNNGYTNVGAGYSIFYAKYAECLCNSNGKQGMLEDVPEEWLELAKSLKLLYDEEHDYHPEFEGYEFGTPIKQADVVLMGFPQLYDMPDSTRRNDLLIYTNVSRDDGPAMTWAMHTVGLLELDDLNEAAHIFNRSYQWYMREPFKIWTEAQPPLIGAINFITGMGGFLQSIFSGYGGLRVHAEKITITKPRVLPDSSALTFRGLKYLDNVIDINITTTDITLTLRQASQSYPLQVASNNGRPIDFVGSLQFSTESVDLILEITTKTPTSCPLPYDKIGVPSKAFAANTHQGYQFKNNNKLQQQYTDVTNCTAPGIFALTFDDGPSYNGNTEQVLQVLAEKGVKATFFVTGYGHDATNLTVDPRKHELLRRIHREGHQIGSHTFSHDSLTANRTREDIITDINRINTALRDIIGIEPSILRPPYGHWNETVIRIIQEEFGYSVIDWNLDTSDWLHEEDIETSFSNYLARMGNASNATDSFIALHHDPVVRSGELAALAIDFVKSKGFRLVTVGECIGNA